MFAVQIDFPRLVIIACCMTHPTGLTPCFQNSPPRDRKQARPTLTDSSPTIVIRTVHKPLCFLINNMGQVRFTASPRGARG